MNDITTRDRANAAKRLAENEDFRLIMKSIEADIFTTFRAVNIGETDKLSNVHALSHGFDLVSTRIAKYIEQERFEAQKEFSEE
ncbi:hypothetical protein [Ensifer canadensis]